jgi:hypothetical protein
MTRFFWQLRQPQIAQIKLLTIVECRFAIYFSNQKAKSKWQKCGIAALQKAKIG